MFSYYTSVLILCWMALAVLCVLVHENDRISPKSKRQFYLTFFLIAVSAFAEWSGVQLDGRQDCPGWLLKAVKCADYILTPVAGRALVQMGEKKRWGKAMNILIGANAAFEIVAVPCGWTVQIDAQNHYTHGPLYPVYFGVCLAVIALIVVQFILYGRTFKRQNRGSLYSAMLLLLVAMAMQEMPGGHRTEYLGMTLTAGLMFIHYSEFYQLTMDDTLAEQRIQLALSQIRPHFLYNTLGSIERLCDLDPKAAKQATRKFSKYLRGNMDSLIGESLIPFEKELQHTRLYLELEQIRFGDALRVEYDIAARDFFLPPLTLEPIVENAVKHGVRMKEDGRGTVSIAASEREDCYEITVKDDGPGIDPTSPSNDGETHIGIRNVKERLDRICGGTLRIDSGIGRGTVVTIRLPGKGEN